MKTFGILRAVIFVLIGAPTIGWPNITIYDVTFEDPPHTLNNPVATGVGMSDRPYGTIGNVITRSGIADFTTQVASLEPAGLMSFFLSAPLSSGLVLLSWDLAMISFGSGGLNDTTSVGIQSSGSGALFMSWQSDNDFNIGSTTVATFILGQQDHYEFFFDLDNDRFDFAFNGVPVFTNQPLVASFNISYVNFAAEYLQDPSYAVDNFRLETIPEPSTWLLVATGGLAAVYGRRLLKAKNAGP